MSHNILFHNNILAIKKIMLGFIKSFIVNNLLAIHKGSLIIKLKSSFNLAISVTPFAFITERLTEWYVSNQSTIFILLGTILADWISGVIKHIKQKTFSWKSNGIGLLIKISMVILGSFLAEALPHFTGDNLVSNTLLMILRLSTFMYVAGSCWMNMSEITNGVFPPTGWINKMKEFNKNLNINDLTKNN